MANVVNSGKIVRAWGISLRRLAKEAFAIKWNVFISPREVDRLERWRLEGNNHAV